MSSMLTDALVQYLQAVRSGAPSGPWRAVTYLFTGATSVTYGDTLLAGPGPGPAAGHHACPASSHCLLILHQYTCASSSSS